jgi:REP element-mobilizing transposase RayT
LRETVKQFDVSMLTYCITCNHTHLLLRADEPDTVSRMMQKLEGEFAEYYNLRKKRSGAFWGGRYWCTMVDEGRYVWNCMKYIDLNMVRAGVVAHPSEWRWCGYQEVVGERRRYRLLDVDEAAAQCGGGSVEAFRRNYAGVIAEAIRRCDLARQPCWTESIAVGGEPFVREIEEKTRRQEMVVEETAPSQWTIREAAAAYDPISLPKSAPNVP